MADGSVSALLLYKMVGCEVKAEGCLEIDGAAGAADADSYVFGGRRVME